MKNVFSIFWMTLLVGCAPIIYQLPYEQNQVSDFHLIDERDTQQKTQMRGSLLITACDYSIKRYADDETIPDRIAFLQYSLAKAKLPKLSGKNIFVKRFTLYDNGQGSQRMKAFNAGAAAGAVAAGSGMAQVSTTPQSNYGCSPILSEGGFLTNENPSFQPVAISEILITIDGQDYFARAVEGANKDGPTLIRRALTKAVDRLIPQLQ